MSKTTQMNRTIGIVNVTGGSAAYPASYLLKEYFSFAVQRGMPNSRVIINNITEIENKSTAYADSEKCGKVVNILGNALENLIASKSDRVAILCNICHIYVDVICDAFPLIRPYFVDIVEGIVLSAKIAGVKKILVLCSENARKSQMFDRYFSNANISVFYADKEQTVIHRLMDAAEQNIISNDIILELYELCSKYKDFAIYFACTELSMIYGSDKNKFSEFKIFDSIDTAVRQLSS